MGLTDSQLLERFVRDRDEAAFTEIVRRHSAMVLGVARRFAAAGGEAEDIFQATFMVLVQRAGSLRSMASVASWLYRVALHAALESRKAHAKRSEHERRAAEMPKPQPDIEVVWGSLRPVLDEELGRLPEKYRAPLVLCYLEGRTNEQAAEELGWTKGTVSGQLARARELLKERLTRRGVSLAGVALPALLLEKASATAPPTLVASTTESALTFAAGGPVSSSVAALTKGVVHAMFWMKFKLVAAVIGAVLTAGGGAVAIRLAAAEPARLDPAKPVAAIPAGAVDVVNANSPWRWHLSWLAPRVPAGSPKVEGGPTAEVAPLPVGRGDASGELDTETPVPPEGWRGPDFDDFDWPRRKGAFTGKTEFTISHATGLLCLRSKFEVADPAAVGALYLSLGYRGGVAVYLNGKEVCRQDLPEGALDPRAPGTAYPLETYVDAKGKLLPNDYHRRKLPEQEQKEWAVRVAARDRLLGPVELPSGALRKGVNVLAVEIHRSDYGAPAMTWWKTDAWLYAAGSDWLHLGLSDLRLAAVGSGFAPNMARPAGIQVWTADVHERIQAHNASVKYGDVQNAPHPMVIAGARNGTFSGTAVVSSPAPLRGVKATVGELAQDRGPGRLPASAAQVNYVLWTDTGSSAGSVARLQAFDRLSTTPPVEVQPQKFWRCDVEPPAAIVPVWLSVRVPRDAPAGEYRGQLTVSADGLKPVDVPVQLSVAGWEVPDPLAFRTHVGLYQSPTTLALHYKVPEWSEEHWQLLEKSFELLARFGNKMVNIPVVDRTQFGNDDGMVTWVRKADGSYEYDFALFDRYIRLVKKHLGTPPFVALHVWHSGGWEVRKSEQETTVTVVDKQTGKREHMQVPVYGTEAGKKFWAPVLLALKERLAKEGLEKSMCIGILSDGGPTDDVFRMFNEIIPGIGWTRGCHSVTQAQAPVPLKGGGVVVCWEYCYGLYTPNPAKKLPRIWGLTGPGVAYMRGGGNSGGYETPGGAWDTDPPYQFRLYPEYALYSGTRGVGRIGLDFWPVSRGGDGKAGGSKRENVYNRWPFSSCSQREPTVCSLAVPGPDGACNTTRLEMIREGVQEAEAMIFLAEALDTKAGRLGPELTAKLRSIFAERVKVGRSFGSFHCRTMLHYVGWQERSKRLLQASAEVAAKL